MEVLPYEDHQHEDEYVPLDPATFPVTVLPVLSWHGGCGWQRFPAEAVARATAFGVRLFRRLRYNRDEIYEDAGNGREIGRFEYDPHVYLFDSRKSLPTLWFTAWIDRSDGISTLNLQAFGHHIEVHYVGRSDTEPYNHPSKH